MDLSPTRTRSRRGAAVAGAAGAGLAVWLIAVPVLGVELAARTGDGEIVVGAPAVALAGVLAALAGWGLLALLERTGVRARKVWMTVALAALVLSLAGPIVQATTVAAGAVLVAMHVAVGTTIVVALGRTARSAPSLPVPVGR
ncbi:hypothetical protein SAMN05216184_12411 [Georgenia satyanarayanai]|uniref:Uncharacterized protein n=1 Tax=Georgenia satyanarayanai TaxID=860221 RepID=A0A2Y9AXM2_9MICO|nr:DUF6069 family protein [Georgenia satyanarayanai]PYF95946.1 hypothetical protein A8987_12411 [Georgenia satyanarayanai]SSA47267.1 hypothetical protein SAMN05216184_12411 [Georgenia satyanarayanai]